MFMDGKFEHPLTSGDINFFKMLYDSRDFFRQLQQRWENRLGGAEEISFAEEYSKGRLSIVCYMELGGSGDRFKFPTIADYKSRINDFIIVVIVCAHTSQLSDRNNWDQKPMLVNDIQLVETPQGVVPSFVWLNYIDEQVENVLPGHLYFSTIDGYYNLTSSITDREIGIPVRDIPGKGNDLPDHNVQGGPQVVNNVTNNQRNLTWKGIGIERQDITPTRVIVDMQTVEVSFKECNKTSLKLLDVLVGPFDL